MNALSVRDIVALWERGQNQNFAVRAFALLTASCPDSSRDVLLRLSIGQRDAFLVNLRMQTFGSQFSSVVFCEKCGERSELTFDGKDLLPSLPAERRDGAIELLGFKVVFRAPNSSDLLTGSLKDSAGVNRRWLLQRCVENAERDGEPIAVADIPESVLEEVAKRMSDIDPMGDVQLRVSCASCGMEWDAAFDIVSFFWSEIEAVAQRTLLEVHQLASVYGWSESDILGMNARRRTYYLNLVGQ